MNTSPTQSISAARAAAALSALTLKLRWFSSAEMGEITGIRPFLRARRTTSPLTCLMSPTNPYRLPSRVMGSTTKSRSVFPDMRSQGTPLSVSQDAIRWLMVSERTLSIMTMSSAWVTLMPSINRVSRSWSCRDFDISAPPPCTMIVSILGTALMACASSRKPASFSNARPPILIRSLGFEDFRFIVFIEFLGFIGLLTAVGVWFVHINIDH